MCGAKTGLDKALQATKKSDLQPPEPDSPAKDYIKPGAQWMIMSARILYALTPILGETPILSGKILANGSPDCLRNLNYPTEYQSKLYAMSLYNEGKQYLPMYNKICDTSQKMQNLYEKALEEERNPVTRFGRFARRSARKAKKSRIAKELRACFKTALLGSKMFYEVLDMKPGTDLSGWAESHKKDFDSLSNDMKQIQEMDGWSLTGKNTPIEAFINKAYEKEFSK